MKILVLSGEVTHQRPMSYGLPHDWDTSVLSLIDGEYIALCEKYGDHKCISHAETLTFLRRAYERAVKHLIDAEVDVIVGVGYGAHILMNLNISHEWRGPSIYIISEGPVRHSFVPVPLLDEIDDVRPVRIACISVAEEKSNRSRQKVTISNRRWPYERESIVNVHVSESDWMKSVYSTGLLSSCINALQEPS